MIKINMAYVLRSLIILISLKLYLCNTIYSRSNDHDVFKKQKDILEIALPPAQDEDQPSSWDEHQHYSHPRKRRSATDRDTHTRRPFSSEIDLNDDHTNAMISWAGKTPDVVALTKNYDGSGRSNLYVSTDYGQHFTNVVVNRWSCLCTTVHGGMKNASVDNLYHASAVQDSAISATSYIFTDKANNLIVYTRDLRNFTTVHVEFQPIGISFHPVREDVVLAYGTATSASAIPVNNLYISYDFGSVWSLLKSNVQDFQWGWQYDQLFVMVPSFLGISGAASIYDVKELTYDGGIQEKVVIYNVHGFQLEGSFMFATKRASLLPSSDLTLHVSKNGSDFIKAEFPVIAGYSNLEYYIVDADEDRVMLCVVHDKKSSHLYVSDTTGTKYTLSLPNIVYVSPTSVGSTALPGLRYYAEPFADIHKVAGLRGIYIASQFLTNKSTDLNLADMNQTTRITYDKGGEWTHITAPYSDMNNVHTHCFWYAGCTLHLLQDFLFSSSYKAASLLSSENAIGLVMGSGVMGYTLKEQTNPSIFLSTDAGFNWKEVARGNYTYNFGDHGNLIVMVPSRKETNTLLYSHDEGETWNEYIFTTGYRLIVYGLLTEPGSKSGNFSIWGSHNKSGGHSWVIVHVDLVNIFPGSCNYTDYKQWSPGINVTSKEICLLGEQEVVERKIPSSFCYNGKEYERLQYSKTCKCIRSDYECDYGYIRINETDDLWNPFPSIHFTTDIQCVRDHDVVNVTNQKPDFCPYGTSYEATKGYRKIPGDVCQGGDNHKYDRVHRHCPNNNKTDFLIYSTGVDIYKYDLATQRREFLVRGSSASEIYSVEFDYNRDILYWASQDTDSVMYYNVSDYYPTPHVLLTGNLGKIESLSLDWESDNLYLLDSTTPKIEIFTILTHWRRTIVQNNATYPAILENPRALDIFPLHGMMFWTDWSTTAPRVMKAGMSGLNPTTVITGAENALLYWPNGLAVDFDKELIYIIDGYTHSLIVCEFDGSNARSMLTDPTKILHPFSLSLLKDRLYWSDWTDSNIKSVYSDRDEADGYYIVVSSEQRIMSVKAMNWDKQYQGNQTGCGISNGTNGGCSNICVPSAHPNVTVSTHRYCLCSEESKPLSYINASNEHCKCESGEKFNVISGNCERNTGSNCSSGQFACSSGTRCIPDSWKCDRDGDCSDSSDEYNCPSRLCESDEFLCKVNQRCISRDWLCDGANDCGDLSDEREHCDASCGEDKFQCTNTICIPLSYKCDGENDCGIGDNSDESDCAAVTVTCGSNQFGCNSTRFGLSCIPANWKCDDEYDCDDHSDEFGCVTRGCNQNQFTCSNSSQCISKSWLCDGDDDCGDMSDETTNCTRTPSYSTTAYPSSSFDCLCRTDDGRCVSYDAQCDGHNDCPDGRDEWWCSFWTTTTSTLPPCYGFKCSNGLCLTNNQVCDGTLDCHPSHEDEANCNNCRPEQVRCAINKNQCINHTQLCDGREDCFGATDEEGCRNATAPTQCFGTFQCQRSKICIDMWRMCDDRWDCGDGSDEVNCNHNVSVSDLTRTYVSDTTAKFRWNSSPAKAGLDIKYIIQYIYVTDIRTHQMNTSKWINATITTNTSGTVTGLEPYTNYMFMVRALVTSDKKQTLGLPSAIIRLSTNESAPGPVSDIGAKVDEIADEPGYWILSWHYPLHPRGRITKYKYNIIVNGVMFDSGEREAVGTGSVKMSIYIRLYDSQMTIAVWAVNGAGEGEKTNKTHCLELPAPVIQCSTSTASSINLALRSNQDTKSYISWNYFIRVNYQDIDSIPRFQRVALDSRLEDYDVMLSNLAAGRKYDITAEVERWLVYTPEDEMPSCTSTFAKTQCSTSGESVDAVTGFNVSSSTANSAKLTWNEVAGITLYEVVMATERVRLEEGEYDLTFNSSTNQTDAPGLLSCEMYFAAVRAKLPNSGPLSAIKVFVTDDDILGPPRHLKTSSPRGDGLQALFDPWEYVDRGDIINVTISWVPACHKSNGDHTVYITGDDHEIIKHINVRKGINKVTVSLERGGGYSVVVLNAIPNGKNSSALHFSAAPYKAPYFIVYTKENTTDEIRYNMLGYDQDIIQPYSRFGSRPPFVLINIQYKVDDGAFIDNGNDIELERDGSCNITTIEASPHNYTVRIRYVRTYEGHNYFGNFGTSWILINDGHKVANVPSTAASTGKGGQGKIGMYVGIAVSVVVVLVLTVLLSVWCVRHKRLQRSFLDFTSSHYNTRTDNATFNTDDDDSPMIQGFSDDEPLVIA